MNQMIQKVSRARGRPRHFDEAEALVQATKVFWAKGYDGATVDDLVAGTGVGRPSLYATFGDKAALFMRCLEHYGEQKGALAIQALQEAPDTWTAIRAFLRQSVASATDEGSPWGCFMVCVAPVVDDSRIREFLTRATAGVTQIVERRLRDGVAAGDLPADFPCAVRARQSLDLSRGLVIRARLGESREDLLADAEEAAVLLLTPTVESRLE